MNINQLKIASIDRIIAHEIQPKKEKSDAFAVPSSALLVFSQSEKEILITRVQQALCATIKTFKLDYEDKSEKSVYALLNQVKTFNDQNFIDASINLAESLANAHFRTKIPGGFCLIGNGLTEDNKFFFFVIKAELQEVFNISNNELKLIKDVFLSPAKDFYKIGFFIESGKFFTPYMYDDQFSLQKKDLTEYFYGKFLGLTTDKNDSLKAKNFFDDTKGFIEANVENFKDRLGLLKALHVLFREETSGYISAKDFSDKYLENKLKRDYDKKIVQEKYPISFIKDTRLLNNKMEYDRISIPLSFNIALVGSTSGLEDLDIINNPDRDTLKNIGPLINNGQITKMILLKQVAQENII